LERVGANTPAHLSAQIAYGARLADVAKTFHHTETEFKPGYGFSAIRWRSAEDHEREEMPIGPKCYGYGAGRRLGSSALSGSKADDASATLFLDVAGLRDAGSATLFSDAAELRNAEEWLLQTDYSASKPSEFQRKQQERLDQVKQMLLNILPEVDAIRFDTGSGTRPIPEVEFQTPYGWVQLRQLGYGYRTLIGWMVDLASRMVERYPESSDPLAEPAVVLVDEIDLHLHPTWQRKLIGYLTERFPNTQFIATAHSPLIVQAASEANLVVLRREGDHVVIDNDFKAIRGWTIDQVLTSDLFGLESSRPPEYDRLLARRKELLSKGRLTQANKKELAQLKAKIGQLPGGETGEDAKEMLEAVKETQRLIRGYQAQKS
jgi:hypothetical protein